MNSNDDILGLRAAENSAALERMQGRYKSDEAPRNRRERRAEEARNRKRTTAFQIANKRQIDGVMADLTADHGRAVNDEEAKSIELQLAVLIHENRRKTEPQLPCFRDLRPTHPGHRNLISVALAAALTHLQAHSSRPVSNA